MDRIAGDKLRGHVEPLVLAALEQGPSHGLEIVKRIEQAGSGALQLKEGSLYPALYRLENDRLVQGQWETERSGRRGARRRLYRLTKAGKRRLASARNEWREFVQVMSQAMGELS